MSINNIAFVSLEEVLSFLQDVFDTENIADLAINGLQIENNGRVTKIATAVDVSLELLNLLSRDGYDLLFVHHGLYWSKPFAITERNYLLVKKMIESNIALIGMHLPLDIHKNYGNNALIAERLGLNVLDGFGNYKGNNIAFLCEFSKPKDFADFAKDFSKQIGEPLATLEAGNHLVKKVGICSGGGSFAIEEAKKLGCDTYITGDSTHVSYHFCKESGVHLVAGGHYNTELWGVKKTAGAFGNMF